MALKITIEVDGQTEAQLAPVVGRLVTPSPGLTTGVDAQVSQPQPSPKQRFYQENAAVLQQHLQQQVQQLIYQNQQLQAQLSSQQPRLAGAPHAKALPAASPATSPAAIKQPSAEPPKPKSSAAPKPQRPKLPIRYQPGRGEITVHRLYRSGQAATERLWKLLLWLCLGKDWLALLLLLGGGLSLGLYGGQKISPMLTHNWRAQPEFVEKTTAGPGDTVTPAQTTHESRERTDRTPNSTPNSTPTAPSSKAGSKPPPPPAFQNPNP